MMQLYILYFISSLYFYLVVPKTWKENVENVKKAHGIKKHGKNVVFYEEMFNKNKFSMVSSSHW